MIIKTKNCECCGKLIKLDEVKKYKPRNATRIVLLCDDCYQDFVKVDAVIKTIHDNMTNEDD